MPRQTPARTYLALHRLERELRLKDVAAAVGVHARSVAYYEWRQHRVVRAEVRRALAGFFNTTTERLFDRDGWAIELPTEVTPRGGRPSA